MYIAVDFDGTCVTHDFPRVGEDIGAAPVLRRIVASGHKIILNTMRSNMRFPESSGMVSGDFLDDAINWFKDNGIELFAVNINPSQVAWTKSPKVHAHLYIDDKSLGIPLIRGVNPHVDWDCVEGMLIRDGIIIAGVQEWKYHAKQ